MADEGSIASAVNHLAGPWDEVVVASSSRLAPPAELHKLPELLAPALARRAAMLCQGRSPMEAPAELHELPELLAPALARLPELLASRPAELHELPELLAPALARLPELLAP